MRKRNKLEVVRTPTEEKTTQKNLGNKIRKTIAITIVVITTYLIAIGIDLPAITNFQFNWAYVLGMTAAVMMNFGQRFLKHRGSLDFKRDKLLKSHILLFVLVLPANLIFVLPKLGPSQGVSTTDFRLAFLATIAFIVTAAKGPTDYKRLVGWINERQKKT